MVVLPDGRLVVKSSPMCVGTIGTFESVDLSIYVREVFAMPGGVFAPLPISRRNRA